ncbi:MAG: glycosyltransferase family 4 protein [Anaerolineae bacterium]|nr:glycosyltransferase family 4 protein [Anaerolineae bacterium]
MRLFVATGIFHPESGGPATYLHGLLPEVQAAGHEVRLLTFGTPTPEDAAYGYPVQRIPRRSFAQRPLAYAAYGLASRPLLDWADVTFIHTTGIPLWGSRRAPRVIKIVGDQAWERAVRLGLVPPTEDIDDFQHKRYGPVVDAVRAYRTRKVQGADQVIVPSQYLRRMVVGWGIPESQVSVIYNALSPEAVAARSALSQAEARKTLGLPDGPVLLSVARLTAWKGIGPLIRAVAAVPEVCLLVAGDGPLMGELQQMAAHSGAADRIALLGRVSREQVAVMMRAADYTVLYSGYEGLSHTLLESLHAGTPVIASDKGGNPEVVQPGVNGLLVPYNNQTALADALREALRPGVRAQLAAGTGAGMERFAWERMVSATIANLEAMR